MSEEILARLKKVVSSQLGVEESEIREESHLQEDLNADPLSIADLIVNLEGEFGIKISQDQAIEFKSVGDILNFISDQTGDI
ncbi:MAG TPA: acyl carrier protein [Candidatus Nanoarchaeia archaeon]